jgi:hypothetical protein
MSDPRDDAPFPADESVTKIGLLMEAAIAHQRLAEDSVDKLQAMTRSIDAVVRDEIRRTVVNEFVGLSEECRRAVQALHAVKRAASLRMMLWTLITTAACISLALIVAWRALPSKSQIARLSSERDRLGATVAMLERRGGRIDLRTCGAGRLCVRIDLKQPAFGTDRNYHVVQEE